MRTWKALVLGAALFLPLPGSAAADAVQLCTIRTYCCGSEECELGYLRRWRDPNAPVIRDKGLLELVRREKVMTLRGPRWYRGFVVSWTSAVVRPASR